MCLDHRLIVFTDALPGIGHACGHNLIAIASISAALATKHVMEKFGIPGKVVLFGTPAEEGTSDFLNLAPSLGFGRATEAATAPSFLSTCQWHSLELS